MKLQVTQENLSRALNAVARVATTRNALPILANVLLKTVDNRLVVAATNLDVAITETIGAKVTEPGALTVPARLMQDFVASLPSGTVDLSTDNFKLNLSLDQYTSTINGVPADEYPVMPALQAGKTIKLDNTVLKQALQQTVFAASSDDTRPVLTGVYMHTLDGNIYLAATDSYRLAERQLVASKDLAQLIIPASSLQDVLRILSDHSDSETTITFDEQQVRFQIGDVEIITRLIDGNYPDYRKLLPKKFAVTALVSKAELTSITKIASLFAREAAGSIQIKISEKDKSLGVRSVASQLGENNSQIKGQVTGTGTVTLNSRYLLDALGVTRGDKVEFCMNGKLEPCIVRDPDQSGYAQVVMPVKS